MEQLGTNGQPRLSLGLKRQGAFLSITSSLSFPLWQLKHSQDWPKSDFFFLSRANWEHLRFGNELLWPGIGGQQKAESWSPWVFGLLLRTSPSIQRTPSSGLARGYDGGKWLRGHTTLLAKGEKPSICAAAAIGAKVPLLWAFATSLLTAAFTVTKRNVLVIIQGGKFQAQGSRNLSKLNQGWGNITKAFLEPQRTTDLEYIWCIYLSYKGITDFSFPRDFLADRECLLLDPFVYLK